MINKICLNCGNKFLTYPSIDQKCCNRVCNESMLKKRKYEKYKCVCIVCSREFLPKRPKDGGIFCSYECTGIHNRKDRIDRNGYWYICIPDHPRANRQGHVPEHHIIMEEHKGFFVEDGFVVHHIDENKKNNKIENLLYMTDSEHKSYHAKKRGRKNGKYK